MDGLLEKLRQAEIEAVRDCFRPGARVLEIGGGSGWQASLIASWGCEVVSVDVAERPSPPEQYFPVQTYDGEHLPFPDASFDLVVSSNVLEHVRALAPLLAETRRVLRPDGRAVHILPSTSWRLWTILGHYPDLLRRLRARARDTSPHRAYDDATPGRAHDAATPSAELPGGTRGAQFAPDTTPGVCGTQAETQAARRGLGARLRTALLDAPHGEYPNSLAELYYFSRRRWLRLFRRNGFTITRVAGNDLFYTGQGLLPGMRLETRRTLARVLGSSCHVFVMRPAGE